MYWRQGVNGGVGGTPPDKYFSRFPNECGQCQNINCLLDATYTVELQNVFDLIARENHPTNFGCINVSSIDL